MEEKDLLEQENKVEEEKETNQSIDTVQTEETEEVKQEYTGPVIKTKTRYDYRTMKYFNMYNMVYKKHFRIVYVVMGILAIAFGIYSLYTGVIQNMGTEDYTFNAFSLLLPIVFVGFGVYFIYEAIWFERVIDKNITNHFMRNPQVVSLEVTVTEEEVSLCVMNSNSKPFAYNWAYVTEIVDIPEYYFMYVQKQPIIIEKDPNKVISGDYDEMVRIIKEHTATKPYKKFDKELVTKPITYVHPDETYDNPIDIVEEDKEDNQEKND